jgi:hypothetical protein
VRGQRADLRAALAHARREPILICLSEHDLEIFAEFLRANTAGAARAELRIYPLGHFRHVPSRRIRAGAWKVKSRSCARTWVASLATDRGTYKPNWD